METVMPSFVEFGAEAAIIGRLLAGHGELEFEMGRCLGAATLGDFEAGVRSLFSSRGEAPRIKRARDEMVPPFKSGGLGAECVATLDDMDWCRELRNQYAHCSWYHTIADGLGFVDLEKIGSVPGPLATSRKMLDIALLEEQEAFFRYVQRCFWYLEAAYDA